MSQLITKGSTPQKFVNQGIKFVKIECIGDDQINASKCLFIDENAHNKELKRSILKEYDLVFAIAGATIGKVNIVTKEILPANTNQALAIVRLNKEENVEFIYQILKSDIMKRYIKDNISVGAQPNLNLEQMNNFSFFQPTDIEQAKLSTLLTAIGKRIQTQSKIIRKLKSLISDLNDKIFSEQSPFSNITDSWDSYPVSEVLEFFPTNSISWENLDYVNGTILNLHYGIIHKGNWKGLDLSKTKLPFIKQGALTKKAPLCKDGDLVFADASEDLDDVGKVIEFLNCGDLDVASGLHTIHARDKMNLTVIGFKGFAFSSKYFRDQIKRLAHGTKVYSISPKKLQECTIRIPCKKNQEKIVGLLQGLENKIETEIQILNQLEKQKDFLLKNLFI